MADDPSNSDNELVPPGSALQDLDAAQLIAIIEQQGQYTEHLELEVAKLQLVVEAREPLGRADMRQSEMTSMLQELAAEQDGTRYVSIAAVNYLSNPCC